jgi:hypothetical protein
LITVGNVHTGRSILAWTEVAHPRLRLTLSPNVSRGTVAGVSVDSIDAGSPILADVRKAVVDLNLAVSSDVSCHTLTGAVHTGCSVLTGLSIKTHGGGDVVRVEEKKLQEDHEAKEDGVGR